MARRMSRSFVKRGCERYAAAKPPMTAYFALNCARAAAISTRAFFRSSSEIGGLLDMFGEYRLLQATPFRLLSLPALRDGGAARRSLRHIQSQRHEGRDFPP